MDKEIQEARAKLAEKFGDSTRMGGKGTARKKQKVVHKTTINDDSKLKQAIKKLGAQPLPGIEEVNMFKDDNTIINFKRPEVFTSMQSNAFAVMGRAETKNLLPDIITQLGPKQIGLLKDSLTKKGGLAHDKIEEVNEDEDEIPGLVNQNFEEVSKKEQPKF